MMMEEEEQAQAPQLQQAPPPPSLTQLSDEATAAQKKQFQELLPLMGQYAAEQTRIQGVESPRLLQQHVDNTRLFGPQLIGLAVDAAKQADPSGFSLRESLVQRAQQGLNAGGGLDADEQRYMTEDLRQAQANRGFGTGLNDAISEAQFLNTQRFGREQQRMQAALAALSGRGGVNDNFNPTNATPQFNANGGNLVQGLLTGPGGFMQAGQNAWNQNASAIGMNNRNLMDQWDMANAGGGGGFNLSGGLSGGLSGAATGAMIGSVVPGIGTAIGAGAGGLIGFAGGGLAGRR